MMEQVSMRNFRCFKYVILFLTIVIILPVSLFYFLIENTSCVSGTNLPGVQHAVKTRELTKTLRALLRQDNIFSFTVSEEEINSVFSFMHRGMNRLDGAVDVIPKRINVTASLKIPHTPFGEYINVRFAIFPSDQGLEIANVSVGKIVIPGSVALHAGRLFVDLILGKKTGSLAVDTVEAVSINAQKVTLKLRPMQDWKERITRVKKQIKSLRDSVALLGDPLLVRIYYEKLIEIDQNLPAKKPVSLASYIGPLFELAQKRTGLPEEENQAAILALAMFLGHGIEESFIGPVRTPEMKKYKRSRRKVSLGSRTDLRLHFLVSAFLKILSDRGISHTVGEFKELMDSRKGGSGFSFIDLAADRAGVSFAEMATNRSGGARRTQKHLAREIQEKMFFPDITDLPEGLTQSEFERFYQNVESNEYRALVRAIDKCIARLPVYRPQHMDNSLVFEKYNISEVVSEQLTQFLFAKANKDKKKNQAPRESFHETQEMSKNKKLSSKQKPNLYSIPQVTPTEKRQPNASKVQSKTKTRYKQTTTRRENPLVTRLERKLSKLRGMYTENHPDVVTLRRRLNALRKEEEQPANTKKNAMTQRIESKLSALRQKYTENHPDVVALRRRLNALQKETELPKSSSP